MTRHSLLWMALAMTSALTAPATAQTAPPRKTPASTPAKILPATSYTLPNGLKVIHHIDRSDPVVAVVLAAHVGSARETAGRTGFAHMFEHLFFLDSENLGPGGLDKMSARIGGTGANGNTNRDATLYLQEAPNDALEKLIWAEADKLGFFIKTVTPAVLQKEKQVVKNEKRQTYDNRPYGHAQTLIAQAMYPADHPYSWTTIGSMADLDAAQLGDVQDFYRRWYTPNNTTLTIAGDFDEAQARAWVVKYFGEFKRGAEAPRPKPRPTILKADKSIAYEDSFAKLPQLTLDWPTVPTVDRDQVTLELLYALLTDGRDAPLTKALVEDAKVTDAIGGGQYDNEIAGEFMLQVRAFDGVALDKVKAAIDAGFRQFERDGVSLAALERAKAQREVQVYGGLTDLESKAQIIARREAVSGDANFLDVEIARARAVTPADVMRVYRRYIASRPHVALSIVPAGQPALALTGATMVRPVTEPIVQGAEQAVDQTADRAAYVRTPSTFDRTKEPPFGPTPKVTPPTPWQARAANGLAVSGIEDRELPTALFEISFDGGQQLDDPAKPGGANLLARMMTRGTARRTPAELENALKTLGADVTVTADRERITLSGVTLSRTYDATMALVHEMLLEPRWDPAELALAKAAVTAEISDNKANPTIIARRVTDVVTYGPDSILSRDILGSPTSVMALSMDDLKALRARMTPGNSRFRITGAVTQAQAMASLAPIAAGWTGTGTPLASLASPPAPSKARLYFYDIPDAKQSTLMFTAPGPRRADPEYYPATVLNYILGGGGFASRLTQSLREGKGYTYGIRSRFEGYRDHGRFTIESPVRANVTLEAAELTRQITADYGRTFTSADLDVTKAYLTKSRAFSFESPMSKLSMLALIGDYGLPLDYPAREAGVVEAMSIERIRDLAATWLQTGHMTYVIVGDAATQAKRLDALGLGPAVSAKPLID